MSLEVPEPIVSGKLATDISKDIVYKEIMHTEGFKSLSSEQLRWFEDYAAPLIVDAALATGREMTRELAAVGETEEEQTAREAEIYLWGTQDMNDYLGRNK